MIDILLTQIPTTDVECAAVNGPAISQLRSERIERQRQPADRARSLSADLLLDNLSRAGCGRSHRYNPAGAPVSDSATCFLSAAHDGNWVAAATAPEPLGIDVVDTSRIAPDASAGHLHPDERTGAARLSPAELVDFLAVSWGAKEAYLKKLGIGLAVHPAALATRWGGYDLLLVDDRARQHLQPVLVSRIDRRHLLTHTATAGRLWSTSRRSIRIRSISSQIQARLDAR